ncbi:hypothetical protein GXB85_09550 [Cellulomonas sp. APG4]|uniref:hypothetical protein n=1 Tax=Cellulomonas sp. APG4 TaxID=1538656 RepID=UPI00137AD7D7|nr:hypothetical protein [Cellulomonas sp. APG4]NCT91193.1 hypothetical protein [Cellulomonas sp. APG4]
MTTAVLLDHVSAYAAAVRSHLADLSPEQVDDLTDGLEADLAEALEDPTGAVATGEIPIGRVGAVQGSGALIDLTRRFGPAADYAAELRAAAALVPAPTAASGARQLGRSLVGLGERTAARARAVASRPGVAALAGFTLALRPVWWLVRGWVWFVFVIWLLRGFLGFTMSQGLLPTTAGAWLLLALTTTVSVQWGRGRLVRPTVLHWAATGGNVLAVVLALPLAVAAWGLVSDRIDVSPRVSYVEVPVYEQAPPQDGVWVDGMQVSNLFVYDADGGPLTGVQVFDDRGREVRTIGDDPWATWALPGVAEPWRFLPAQDDAGRDRWNVHPLLGAPAGEWEEGGSEPTLLTGATASTPPVPFAKAPSVTGDQAGDGVEGSGGAATTVLSGGEVGAP